MSTREHPVAPADAPPVEHDEHDEHDEHGDGRPLDRERQVERPLDHDGGGGRPPDQDESGDQQGPGPDGAPADEVEAERRPFPWRRVAPIAAAVVVVLGIGLFVYISEVSKRVKIDDVVISAPQTALPAHEGGTLKEDYASIGDSVRAHHPIARVGNELITSDVTGSVISIRQDLGASIAPGTTVATLIDRGDLRAIGRIKEDKGLSDLRIGQRAEVSVDAFGGRELPGVVEEISEEPHQQSLSFSVSEKQQAQEYDVKVRFDGAPDPGLRQGMSASMKVYK